MSTFKDEIVNEILQMNKVNNPTYKFKFLVPSIDTYSMSFEEYHFILDFDTFLFNSNEEDLETVKLNWKNLTDPRQTKFDITRLGKLYDIYEKYPSCNFIDNNSSEEREIYELKIFAKKISQEII